MRELCLSFGCFFCFCGMREEKFVIVLEKLGNVGQIVEKRKVCGWFCGDFFLRGF